MEGHTSPVGGPELNKSLSSSRIEKVIEFLGKYPKELNGKGEPYDKRPLGKGGDESKDKKNEPSQQKTRFVKVWIEPDYDNHPDNKPETLDPKEKENAIKELDNIEKELNEQRAGGFIGGECLYFKELKENDPFIFNSYKQKIDYFHPGFHSQTPEDFNKRLTFLHQCTRQGKPFPAGKDAPSNSVFGRMPICVLRIGDFFNCRIIINNIGFSYDPLLWDLNPEGSGIQPMLCNVNINCNIIGGASLAEPITQLQNAISSKFYANHQEITREELEDFRGKKGLDRASGMGPENPEVSLKSQ